MSDHRLHNAHERQDRIRQCAYYLWEADGRPHGRDREYWQRAEALIGIEDQAAAGQLPGFQGKPDAGSGVKAAKIRGKSEASPDAATDQTVRRQAPKSQGRVRKAKPTTTQPDAC